MASYMALDGNGLDFPQHTPAPAHRSTSDSESSSENSVSLKILVNNNVAGSLIGKGGSSINELQSQSGARIKLSQSNDFFPNTRDRVALILGNLQAVNNAQALILHRISQDQAMGGKASAEALESTPADPTAPMTAKFIIPSRSAGVIIGQGGANIRELHEQSGARLQLHNRREDGSYQELLKERIVTVTGTLSSCKKAIELCLLRLVDENSPESPVGTLKYQNMTTSYSRIMNSTVMNAAHSQPAFMSSVHMPQMQQQTQMSMYPSMYSNFDRSAPAMFPDNSTPTATVNLPVPDHMIGALLGKGGNRITEIQQISGARVSISQRGDYIPGTQNRMVSITGTQQATQTAQLLIHSKLEQALASPESMPSGNSAFSHPQPGLHLGDSLLQGREMHHNQWL